MKSEKRPYDNRARAAKADATRRRIMECAAEIYRSGEIAGFTLEAVAAKAGTSVQTILRTFGSKDALLVAALDNITVVDPELTTLIGDVGSDDVPGMVAEYYRFYDEIGDAVIRHLADEIRIDGLQGANDVGREAHRDLVERAFARELDALAEPARTELFNALMVATDLYVWQILRRDQRLDRVMSEAVVVRIINGLIKGGLHR